MKKTIRIVCTLVSLTALSLLLMFALSPDKEVTAEKKYEVDGTWRVYANVSNGVAALADDEVMVFENGKAIDYRDGTQYIDSDFTIEGEVIRLPDLKTSYHIMQQSDNCMRLYQSDSAFIQLVRAPSLQIEECCLTTEVLTGLWDITFRLKENPNMLEQLRFEADTLYLYRNGAAEPAMEAVYSTNDAGNLYVAAMGKEMRLYKINDSAIVMVEQMGDVGFVWELTAVSQ